MKYISAKDFMMKSELVERLAAVNEQLEDIVSITKGKDLKEPQLSLEKISGQMKKKIGGHVPLVLFAIFRMFALKNLLRGRMHITAYTVGRQIGLGLKIDSPDSLKKEMTKLGIGPVVIKRLDSEGVKIILEGSITSMGIKNSGQPICYFERGLLSGAAERIIRKKVDLIEETCCSQGDPYCTFRGTLSQDKKGRVSSTTDVMSTDLYSKENVKMLATLASHSISAIENAFLFEEVKRQSMIDGLTNVYNHGYFRRALKVEASSSSRYKTPLSLVMMDIDNFKQHNDKYGHHQGDRILKAIASFLAGNVRDVDIVARYGGDEFALILPQTDLSGAHMLVDRLQEKMRTFAAHDEKRGILAHVSLSFGIANATGMKMVKPEAIFEKADKSLMAAKRKGRKQAIFAEPL